VIVLDTSVLSLVLRRRRPDETHPAVNALQKLLEGDTALAIPGIVFQEVLSGVRQPVQFKALLGRLQNFSVLVASLEHHIQAAQITNFCSSKGITIAVVDALIAAQTVASDGLLFTTDQDFTRIAPCASLKIFDYHAFLSA
jgi:predicted nucleic acid-binding protein